MPAHDSSLFSPAAPLARVSLHDSASGTNVADVPMLIDSGADVTLVPQSAIALLGAAVDPNQSYELMGFDGSTSIALAVRLDLVFLKRIFRGRFLVINQDCGILGRDVFNRLSLLLDWPATHLERAARATRMIEYLFALITPGPLVAEVHRLVDSLFLAFNSGEQCVR